MGTIATSFAAETRSIGGTADRQVALCQDHIAEDVRYRYLSGRDKVKVVYLYMVHLSFLIGELSCTIARILIDHMRHLVFQITRLGILVQEIGDERSLQLCPFVLIDGEACSCQFYS